jgi:Protein of unknown function (DUF3995)
VAFRVLSLYWAAGGTLGVDQLAASLQEDADERATGFVAIVAATGIAKLLGAIVPLSLVFRPHSRTARKVLLSLCWAGGAVLAVYGLTDVVTGSIGAAPGTTENAIWYAVLWGPTLAAWRAAVPDDSLDVRRGTQAGVITDRPTRQRATRYALRVQPTTTDP